VNERDELVGIVTSHDLLRLMAGTHWPCRGDAGAYLGTSEVIMGKLKGKTAIITGGAGGIGQATAQLFMQEGANVMLVDRDETALRQVCERLGRHSAFFAADVSDPNSATRYVEAARSKFGGVDVLFANAGIEGNVGPLVDMSIENFDHVLAVNVRGVFLGIRAAAPEMIARGGGSIIVTSSVAGLIGSPGLSAYVTSKHAIIGLARCAALELAPHFIRVNTVNPGPIENRMMRSIENQISPSDGGAVKQEFEKLVALGRYGTNEEIAKLALFLASSDSSYCTGSVFVADGGFTAQ
jgi:3alpha(or 20beta)-hydroxysteroid dehydrogenase